MNPFFYLILGVIVGTTSAALLFIAMILSSWLIIKHLIL